MPRWYSAGGRGGGGGVTLGPTPNLFAATAEDAGSAAGIAAAAATDRAAAEALRDKWTGFDYIESMFWRSGSNRTIGDTRLVLFSGEPSVQNFTAFTASPGWILPAGTEITWSGFTYKTTADVTVILHATGGLMFVAVLDTGWKVRPGQEELAVSIPNGDWLQGYDGTGLNVRLYFDDSGVKTYVHQVFQHEQWIDQVPIVPLEGVPGADGGRTDFSSIPTDHIVSIGAGSAPIDSGFEASGSQLLDPDGDVLAKVSDIPASLGWSAVTGKPSFYSDTDFDARLQALITAGAGDSIGATLNFDATNGKLFVVVGANHPEPVISSFAMTGVDHVYTVDHTITGQQTWTWAISDRSSVRGTLTLSEERHDAGTGVTTTTDLSTSIASDANTVSLNVTPFALNDVGSYVIFTLKGTSVNSNAFSATYRVERQAAAATTTVYWGVIPDTSAATNFADATVERAPSVYEGYFTTQSHTKTLQSGDKVDGEYTFDAFSGGQYIAFLIPSGQGALTKITNKASQQFPGLGTFNYIAPTGTTKYHRYIISSSQNGSFFPKTYLVEE